VDLLAVPVAAAVASAYGIAVSPDGRWLAYTDSAKERVMIAAADGSGGREVGGTPVGSAAFTPDTRRVVYNRTWHEVSVCTGWNRCYTEQEKEAERALAGLWSVAVDGTGDTRLTSDRTDSSPTTSWR
jgi:hypothetical protein